jgi:hypothetical protein
MDRTTSDQLDETPPTAEEYAAVRAAVATAVGRRAGGRSWTLNSLIEAWRNVVEDVEDGYAWSAPDLDHDLWCREALAGAWPSLPSRVRAIRQPELDRLDSRFRTATLPWPGRAEEPGRWWRRRVPRILEAEAGEARRQGWPVGWSMMPFPKPDDVEVVD